MAYGLNCEAIVYELLNDEVIVANLNQAVYYSIRGSGVLIWQALIAGMELQEIQALFPSESKDDIDRFIQTLVKDQLILAQPKIARNKETFSPSAWSRPIIEKYEDIKEPFPLDPLHELDGK